MIRQHTAYTEIYLHDAVLVGNSAGGYKTVLSTQFPDSAAFGRLVADGFKQVVVWEVRCMSVAGTGQVLATLTGQEDTAEDARAAAIATSNAEMVKYEKSEAEIEADQKPLSDLSYDEMIAKGIISA